MTIDSNTLQALLALVSMIQVVALAYLAVRVQSTSSKVDGVHTLVNSMASKNEALAADAAGARGELAGRDYATAAAVGASTPVPLPPPPPSP